jgi:SAM-dependent methyltransferase
MFRNYGYCPCCTSTTEFVARQEWWRDHYVCTRCQCIPRERATMYCLDKFFPAWKDQVVHESSPGARGASVRLKKECSQYLPSQFFPGVLPGSDHLGNRCEDLEALTFADHSIDLHVTQDVFEHLFDPARAFQEIARTLRPGGAHIFTTPLVNKEQATQVCARRGPGGEVEQLIHPPEYHGNPVSDQGSLVTVRWGYDIVRHIHQACGLFTEMIYLDSLEMGIRAEYIEVLITRKPAA